MLHYHIFNYFLTPGMLLSASAPSAISWMVPENQMPGGVSTAAIIPLQGFLPVDGVGWWYVGPDVLENVTINFKGGRCVR
jgi:hypothetical protein